MGVARSQLFKITLDTPVKSVYPTKQKERLSYVEEKREARQLLSAQIRRKTVWRGVAEAKRRGKQPKGEAPSGIKLRGGVAKSPRYTALGPGNNLSLFYLRERTLFSLALARRCRHLFFAPLGDTACGIINADLKHPPTSADFLYLSLLFGLY